MCIFILQGGRREARLRCWVVLETSLEPGDEEGIPASLLGRVEKGWSWPRASQEKQIWLEHWFDSDWLAYAHGRRVSRQSIRDDLLEFQLFV